MSKAQGTPSEAPTDAQADRSTTRPADELPSVPGIDAAASRPFEGEQPATGSTGTPKPGMVASSPLPPSAKHGATSPGFEGDQPATGSQGPVKSGMTGSADGMLVFNGVLNDERSSSYLLEPMTPEAFLAAVAGDPLEPPVGRAAAFHVDAEDLRQAGWGVVWGPGVGVEVREALAPLLELRRSQAGELFREVELREGETYLQFLARFGAAVNPIDPKKMPYYLLLVGDPSQVPFEFQYQLDVGHAVGRLSFASAEEYGRYAAGVRAVEDGTVSRPLTLGVFSVQNGDDPATLSAGRDLTGPLSQALAGDQTVWQVDACLGSAASKTELKKRLGGDSTPALLLTCSHGLMFRCDDPLQPTDQGALLCAEWPGTNQWKERIPPDFYLASRDVLDEGDLAGLISFHFACFSAGTPELDSFSRVSRRKIPRRAPVDTIAPLARRLLGKPGGTALAVVGHVDQVFEASYLWPGVGRQLETFDSAFRALMAGQRLGHALESFALRYATIATILTGQLERWRLHPESRPAGVTDTLGRAFLWLAHNDARGYLLLGDPAVRAAAARP